MMGDALPPDFRAIKRWLLYVATALIAGYLTAYILVFPAPILHGREVVPRVLGLSLTEATTAIQKAGLQIHDGGSEPDATAPEGFVIWQDPLNSGTSCERYGQTFKVDARIKVVFFW